MVACSHFQHFLTQYFICTVYNQLWICKTSCLLFFFLGDMQELRWEDHWLAQSPWLARNHDYKSTCPPSLSPSLKMLLMSVALGSGQWGEVWEDWTGTRATAWGVSFSDIPGYTMWKTHNVCFTEVLVFLQRLSQMTQLYRGWRRSWTKKWMKSPLQNINYVYSTLSSGGFCALK